MTILSRNDQKGRSMVEMLGVLAIIGVLSVGGISGYSKAMGKFKTTKAQDQMSMILMNVRTAFATSPSYDGLNNGTAAGFGIVPSEMLPAGTTADEAASVANQPLVNAFGGGFYINDCGSENDGGGGCKGAATDDTKVQYFTLGFDELSREACMALAGVDWGSDGLVGIEIGTGGGSGEGSGEGSGGESVSIDLANPPNNFTWPLPMSEISKGCSKSGSANSIYWTYY